VKIANHIEFLNSLDSDIGVSINYAGIIPTEVIDIFPFGILNAHSGDLPRYRGNACQAWAILNGEDRIGLCIHKMIGGELDNGDIIARDFMPINYSTKVTHTWKWMCQRTPELIFEAIEKLTHNPSYILESQSKDPKDAFRCYPRCAEDGKIDWNRPALNVLLLVNASNKPYSGAFCEYEGQRMRIWDADLVQDNEVFCAVPGQVTMISEGYIEVACGSGKLRIYKTQLDDGDECSPSRFITSIRKRLT
jgi:UDP-4-amino-4-deoxy-L-arabinose formyltransferase/UDP-glucuronic acid dehydrogenase (UDP-4-keto-hexauronic acid decarboxylating)